MLDLLTAPLDFQKVVHDTSIFHKTSSEREIYFPAAIVCIKFIEEVESCCRKDTCCPAVNLKNMKKKTAN